MITIQNQFYEEYVRYFLGIAENHMLIKHEDVSGKRAFVRTSIEEAFLGLDRTGISKDKYILELFNPTIRYSHNDKGQRLRELQGGFQILGHHKNGSNEDQITVMSRADQISSQIINLMRLHSRGNHPLFARSFDDGQNVHQSFVTYGRDGNYAGVRNIFDIQTAISKCVHQSNWCNDLNDDLHISDNDLNCIQ